MYYAEWDEEMLKKVLGELESEYYFRNKVSAV